MAVSPDELAGCLRAVAVRNMVPSMYFTYGAAVCGNSVRLLTLLAGTNVSPLALQETLMLGARSLDREPFMFGLMSLLWTSHRITSF